MKMILTALLVLASSTAMAGWDCKSADGKTTLVIGGSWHSGSEAWLVSPAVQKYYRTKHDLEVGQLVTVMDPATDKAISEVTSDETMSATYKFMQQSEKLVTSPIWNLTFKTRTYVATLTDQEGKTFTFKLKCEMTPDLESVNK